MHRLKFLRFECITRLEPLLQKEVSGNTRNQKSEEPEIKSKKWSQNHVSVLYLSYQTDLHVNLFISCKRCLKCPLYQICGTVDQSRGQRQREKTNSKKTASLRRKQLKQIEIKYDSQARTLGQHVNQASQHYIGISHQSSLGSGHKGVKN